MITARCPICAHPDSRRRPVGELTVLTCRSCGHGWLEELVADNEHFEGDLYRDWRSSISDSLKDRAEVYVSDLIGVVGEVPESVVEIGCATGEVVGRLSDLGAATWGVDTSERAIALARAEYPDVSFAIATSPTPDRLVAGALMMHVIEHVPDPVETLTEVRSLVTSDGFLYLRLPNYGGAAAKVLQGAWPDYMADHVHYFTRDSMLRTLAASGWGHAHVRTVGHAWPWLGGIKRLLTRARPAASASHHAGPPGRRQMGLLVTLDKLGRPLWWLESRLGRGNELVVVARAV